MTTSQAIKEITDYFNLDLTTHGYNKLNGILTAISTTTKTRYVDRDVIRYVEVGKDPNNKPPNIQLLKKKYAQKYLTTVEKMEKNCRESNTVAARVEYARHLALHYPNFPYIEIGRSLRKHHTTVVYWLYNSNVNCEYPRLKKRRNYQMSNT